MWRIASVVSEVPCYKRLSSELRLVLIPGQGMGELVQAVSNTETILYS